MPLGNFAPALIAKYYRDYINVRRKKPPQTESEVVAWSLYQIPKLWGTMTGLNRTLGELLTGSEESKKGISKWVSQSSVTASIGIALWPIVAGFKSRTPGLRAWFENWKGALERPDLYLVVSAGPFTRQDRKTLVSCFPSIAVGQLKYLGDRTAGFFLDDKVAFARLAAEAGLPAVPTVDWNEVKDDETYFVKPRRSLQGLGIFTAKGGLVDTVVDKETHFLQPLVRNHEKIRGLIGEKAPLSTVRIATLANSDGAISVLLAAFRMGAPGSIVDNLHAGGIVSRPDLKTGNLGPGATLETIQENWQSRCSIKAHPSTGVEFAGRFELPDFHEAIDMCKRAHSTLAPDIFRMDWDVALTDEGPVLVESSCAFGGVEFEADDDARDTYYLVLKATIRNMNHKVQRDKAQ